MTDERPPLSIVERRDPRPAVGWRAQRLAGPSDLFGANGMQFGPDGNLYVAQAFGAQISSIDLATGQISHVLSGGPVVAPDDLDFDPDGLAYVTDVANGTTWTWRPGEEPIAHATDQSASNGVTIGADGRIFIDEFRPGGRLLELAPDEGMPSRTILEGLDGPNALDVAPDGRVYFPQVFAGEVWSLEPDSGETRRIAAGLGSPTAVKISASGDLIVPLSAEGVIVQIDPRSGALTTLAEVDPGIDNVALDSAGRLFVSHYVDGQVSQVPTGPTAARTVTTARGRQPRILNPPGFVGPFDVAERPGGVLVVADGLSLAYLEGSLVTRFARLLTADSPGLIGTVHIAEDGRTFVAGRNAVSRYTPAGPRQIRGDFRNATGVALDGSDALLVSDHDAGVVHRLHVDSGEGTPVTQSIAHPTRLTVASNNEVYISDDEAGAIYVQHDGQTDLFAEDLVHPQGIAVDDDRVFVVDAGSNELLAFGRAGGQRELIVSQLPLGAGSAGARLVRAAGLTRTRDGALIVAADGDGSLIRVTSA